MNLIVLGPLFIHRRHRFVQLIADPSQVVGTADRERSVEVNIVQRQLFRLKDRSDSGKSAGPLSSFKRVEPIFSKIDSILRLMHPRCVQIRSQTRLIFSLVFISVLQKACRKQVCSEISSISWATSSDSEVSR